MPAYVEADSFTTVARVQSLVGRGAFTSATHPSLQEVYDFMALRAVELIGKAAEEGITISTSTRLDGSTAMGLADRANMCLAAGDVIFAHDSKDGRPPDRSIALWAEARDLFDPMIAVLKAPTGGHSVRTATATGGITKADFTQGGARAEVDAADLFNMDTRN